MYIYCDTLSRIGNSGDEIQRADVDTHSEQQ